jgi:hypothetical protein
VRGSAPMASRLSGHGASHSPLRLASERARCLAPPRCLAPLPWLYNRLPARPGTASMASRPSGLGQTAAPLLYVTSSAVGTVATTGARLGVRSRLNGARTTPGISPRARYARLVEMTGEEGDEGAFEACHPERSRGVSGHEWGVDSGSRAKPRGLRTGVER